ncbi:hypothetical protein APHAL10511_003523 [Amanita phalloides]|nr:hypothetical protein APHAL10511_003523 [Amanita phalloides]
MADTSIIALFLILIAFPAVYISFCQWENAKSLQGQCRGLTSANLEQQDRIAKLEAELSATTTKAADAARNVKHINSKNQENVNRVTKLQTDFQQLQQKHTRESRMAHDEIHALRAQKEELKHLVDSQAAELTVAREFTFMTDQVSAADVVRTVSDLNSAIYQTAMQLISIIPAQESSGAAAAAVTDERLFLQARNEAVGSVGAQLLDLASAKAKDDESLAIVAFQSGLAHICYTAINSWMFGQVPESQVLKIVYEQIWVGEKQAVAGRWRALTSKQLAGANDQAIRDEILTVLVCTLLCIGWKAEPQHIQSILMEELGDCINEMATFVVKVYKMIREEFISDDLQVAYVLPGQTFNPSQMEAEEGTAMPDVHGPILGTVELGVALRSRSGGQKLLQKPRVALNYYTSS